MGPRVAKGRVDHIQGWLKMLRRILESIEVSNRQCRISTTPPQIGEEFWRTD